MAELKLHDLELSGNCYKIRLFCALLGLKPDIAPVDFLSGAHKKSPLIERNPFGEVPVLEDGDLTLRDLQAILVYLARKYGGERWLPTEPAPMAEVVSWLMVAENEIARGPNDARLHDKFGDDLDVDLARRKAERILGLMKRISRRDGGSCSTARPSPTSPVCPMWLSATKAACRSIPILPSAPGYRGSRHSRASSPCRRYDNASGVSELKSGRYQLPDSRRANGRPKRR